MYIKRAAEIVGITPKRLRDLIRSNPGIVTPVGAGRTYTLTEAEVETLNTLYWSTRKAPKAEAEFLGEDGPGLPLGSSRAEFQALRRERNRRLDAMLKERGMTLAAMPESELTRHGRAMSRKDMLADA